MPLTTRSVSPVDLSIHRLPESVQQGGRGVCHIHIRPSYQVLIFQDELQCVTNGTLANLIRQLSSLSGHAEQMFTDIHREILKIDHRTNTLFLRVDRLVQKISQQSQNSSTTHGTDQGFF